MKNSKNKKLFNEYATFKTADNRVYNINKKRIYIHGKSEYYGKLYIISSDDKEKEDLQVIKEVYSFDNNRLRFLCNRYDNIKIFDTIEHTQDNSIENKITVVEKYDSKTNEICSIGNIKWFHSDLVNYHANNESNKEVDENLLKRLILKKDI